jgi:hypothetical protein
MPYVCITAQSRQGWWQSRHSLCCRLAAAGRIPCPSQTLTPFPSFPFGPCPLPQLLNFTQYKNDADSDISNLPSPLPFPYSETASDARAPGWVSTCIARSPTAPEGCEGDACNVYIEE